MTKRYSTCSLCGDRAFLSSTEYCDSCQPLESEVAEILEFINKRVNKKGVDVRVANVLLEIMGKIKLTVDKAKYKRG